MFNLMPVKLLQSHIFQGFVGLALVFVFPLSPQYQCSLLPGLVLFEHLNLHLQFTHLPMMTSFLSVIVYLASWVTF